MHHKNKNRSDNRIENLELMTFKEHAKLHLIERHKEGKINYHKTPVINVTTGEEFESCIAAAKAYNIPATNISRVCRGKRKTCRNCEWKYKEEN